MTLEQEAIRSRSRLQPIEERGIAPWFRSETMQVCDLYWLPAPKSPIPPPHKEWCLRFFSLLSDSILRKTSAEPELFLQAKSVRPYLLDSLSRNLRRFMPMPGLSRRRNATLPPAPDGEHVEGLRSGEIPFDLDNYRPDYSYWFLGKETEEQVNLFFGYGGLSVLFVPPSDLAPPAVPAIPSVFSRHPTFAPLLAGNRLEKMAATMHRSSHPFFARSKEVFGRGIEDDVAYSGWKYIIPLLDSESFFAAGDEELMEWFSVFDAVLTESPVDRGLLLAAKPGLDMSKLLGEMIATLELEGIRYPDVVL